MVVLRVTVNLPDDVLRAAQSLARRSGFSLGDAIAELVRAGHQSAFPTFPISENARPITLEMTLQAASPPFRLRQALDIFPEGESRSPQPTAQRRRTRAECGTIPSRRNRFQTNIFRSHFPMCRSRK